MGFDPIRPTFNKNAGGDELIVLLEIDGDDFEIVGHENPGSVGRKGTGRKAATRPSAPE